MKKLFLIFAILFSFELKAQENNLPQCFDEKVLLIATQNINKSFEKKLDIPSFRKSKIMLNNVKNLKAVDDFKKEDNIKLFEKQLMLEINDGVEKFVICKNQYIYTLIYHKNNELFVEIFNK